MGHANRRQFLGSAALAATACASASIASGQDGDQIDQPNQPKTMAVCAFTKFLQSLTYKQLAEEIARLGFAGIEATVRKNGHVDPLRVEEQLPQLVEALGEHDLEITVMASDINRSDDPLSRRVLKAAAGLGVKRYRMKYYRYENANPLPKQLDQLRPIVRDLAAFNKELGLQAVYQNHSGARNVGAPVWDLVELLSGVDPRHVAVAFDIRHATVEGGLAWPLHFRRVKPHLGAVYVKDFVWDQKSRRPRNVPLGAGLVDSAFFRQLANSRYDGPLSLHVEYLPQASVPENLAALRKDLASLRRLLKSSPKSGSIKSGSTNSR